MYYLTCQNHTDLRWLVKGIALNRNGRYNGARNLHFCGRVDPSSALGSSQIVNGELVKECPCDASLLTVARESIDEFQRVELPADEHMKEIHDRLLPPPYWCPKCGPTHGGERTLCIEDVVPSEDEIKEVCCCNRCSLIVNLFTRRDDTPTQS